jgi:hypothetical protein
MYYPPMGGYEFKSSSLHKPKNWIQQVVSSPGFKKGAFTAEAKKHGETAKEFKQEVLANPKQYSEKTRKRAQFMANIAQK